MCNIAHVRQTLLLFMILTFTETPTKFNTSDWCVMYVSLVKLKHQYYFVLTNMCYHINIFDFDNFCSLELWLKYGFGPCKYASYWF